MNNLNFETDFIDFINLYNKYKVEYLVIGGYAVSIHGYPRSTKDLDVCIKISEDNAKKMVMVLDDFGFSSLKLTKEDFLKRDFITQLGHEPIRIDIVNDLNGVLFGQAWESKRQIVFEGAMINFIGYADLLTVKEKAGRPQDVAVLLD